LAVAYRLVPSFNKIFISNQALKFGEVSTKKIKEFESLEKQNIYNENDKTSRTISFLNNIELRNIQFSYNENLEVIKNLNFVIKKHDIIGIFGESGSGKSTLINILTCLIKQNKGKIVIDGNELNDLNSIRKYQNLFSIASQDTFLIDGTLKDNIIFGSDKEYSDIKIKEAITFARLDEFVDNLKNGIDTYIGSTIKQISSGQKQRIAIARSIYSDRDILIFDEATNALDEDNEKIILKNIKAMHHRKTIIIISHNLDNLKDCNRIISVQNAEVIEKTI